MQPEGNETGNVSSVANNYSSAGTNIVGPYSLLWLTCDAGE